MRVEQYGGEICISDLSDASRRLHMVGTESILASRGSAVNRPESVIQTLVRRETAVYPPMCPSQALRAHR